MKITEKLSQKDIEKLFRLYQNEWWTKNRTLEETRAVVSNSTLVTGLVNENEELVGFARVLTDYIFKAIIFDLIVDPACRNKGHGAAIIDYILSHNTLNRVRHFELYCLPEMVPFYEKYHFSENVGGVVLLRHSAPL